MIFKSKKSILQNEIDRINFPQNMKQVCSIDDRNLEEIYSEYYKLDELQREFYLEPSDVPNESNSKKLLQLKKNKN